MTRHPSLFGHLSEGIFFKTPFRRTLTTSYRCGGYICNRTGNRKRHAGTRQDGILRTAISDKGNIYQSAKDYFSDIVIVLCRCGSPQYTPSDNVCGSYAPWWGGLRRTLLCIMVLLLPKSSPERRENASPLFEKEQGAAFMVSGRRALPCLCKPTERLPHL